MSVLSVQISTTGQVANTSGLGIGMTQQSPTPIFINTNDTLATVLVAGYLNASVTHFQYPYNNYQLAEVYTTDNGTVWLRVSVTTSGTTTTYSLVSPSESGTITSPTVTNQIAYATNTSATIAATGLSTALFNAGNISAGLSGTAGSLFSFPATATTGKLGLVGVANSGNFTVNISNVAYGQPSTLSFADVGSSTGRFLVANTATPFTTGHLVASSGTGGLTVDSTIATTNVQLKTQVKAVLTGNIGGAGAGPLTITVAGMTAASVVVATVSSSSNPCYVLTAVPGSGSFALTVSADPGASLIVNYIAYIAAQ